MLLKKCMQIYKQKLKISLPLIIITIEMSLQQKTARIAKFLPPNKDIFVAFVQFETVQQVPEAIKGKYFDENLNEIARMMVQGVYKDKEIKDIEQTDVISDLEEWLSEVVRFKLNKAGETKADRVLKPQVKLQNVQNNQQHPSPQQSTFPKPQRIQPPHQNLFPSHQNPQTFPLQSRPQSYYQNPPPQGRQNTIKYAPKQPQTSSQPHSQPQPSPNAKQRQNLMKRQQYDKQNFGWIDSLSKCLNYPEKRFHILPEMHARRKY